MKNYSFKLTILSLTVLFAVGMTSAQIIKTSLRITVLDEVGNPVEEATVVLYETEEDYRSESNPVTKPGKSDAKGRVKFSDLEEKSYFVQAVKDDKNNDGRGAQISPLSAKKQNRINIIIE